MLYYTILGCRLAGRSRPRRARRSVPLRRGRPSRPAPSQIAMTSNTHTRHTNSSNNDDSSTNTDNDDTNRNTSIHDDNRVCLAAKSTMAAFRYIHCDDNVYQWYCQCYRWH